MTPPEMMHVVKNMYVHIVKLLNGTNNTDKVRAAEKQIGRFDDCCSEDTLPVLLAEK